MKKIARDWVRGIVLATVCGASVCWADPTEYFVDKSRPDDSGDGKTVETAKRTIQAAVDLAVDDDIVTVLPGYYDEGGRDAGDHPTRVVIDHKITLRAKEGRAKTFIAGCQGTGGTTAGTGTGAVKCIYMNKAYTLVEGFTICNGGCTNTVTGGSSGYGGAVRTSNEHGAHFYVADCTISNCVAVQAGAIYGATAIGCLITGNRSIGSGAVAFRSYFYNCVVTRNTGKYTFYYPKCLSNCTCIENSGTENLLYSDGVSIYNSVLLKNSPHSGHSSMTLYNCVTEEGEAARCKALNDCKPASDEFQLMAPALADFRPLATSGATTCGDAQWLTKIAMSDEMAEKYRYRDYAGAAIPETGTIAAGAVQAAATSVGARADFPSNFITPELPVAVSIASYAHCGSWPAQCRTQYVSSKPVFMYTFSGWCNPARAYPGPGGWITFTVPPAGQTLTISTAMAGSVLYVDAVNGNDANDGSATNKAFKTLQAAVDAAPSSYYAYAVIYALPGVYDEGGASYSSLSNRVAIDSKTLRIESLAGAEKTIIVGAPDPETGEMGPNAMRCVSGYNSGALGCLSGFTLTGGYTDRATGKYPAVSCTGGGVYSTTMTVQDCIISNNTASKAAATLNGTYCRCIITGNHARDSVVDASKLIGCLVAENECEDTTSHFMIEGSATCRFCTIRGAAAGSTTVYASIVANGGSPTLSKPYEGNVVWNTVPSGEGHWISANPRFVRARTGDFRLYEISPAIGGAESDEIASFVNVPSGVLDGPIAVVDGIPTAGAYHVPVAYEPRGLIFTVR